MAQTIALAVDGMEKSLLSTWTDEGKLPNLDSIMNQGVHGGVNCTSLSSAKQWTTHFTGVISDRHGVDGFLKNGQGRRAGEDAPSARELINLNDISIKTYPELLSESGLAVGLVNPLPLWPPLELEKGFCISGMLTPPSAEDWAHPSALQSNLVSSGYQIDVRYGDRPYGFVDDGVFDEVGIQTLYEDMFEVLDARIDFVKEALKERDLDYLYALLKSIDIIQHSFWAHMQNNDETYGDAILDAYRRVDNLVGWIRAETDANVVVFSDHGFKGRTTRPPEGVHKLAVKLGGTVPIPPVVKHVYEKVFYREKEVSTASPSEINGIHANPAVWLADGPQIQDAGEVDIDFEDIPPTLLTLLKEPIPEEYSGKPATSALTTSPTTASIDLDVRRQLNIGEEDVVSERLHNLGYAEMVDS